MKVMVAAEKSVQVGARPLSDPDYCIRLASGIIWARRLKYLKDKGRKLTTRSHQQYLKVFWRDFTSVLIEALTEAKQEAGIAGSAADATPDERAAIYRWALWILYDQWCQENPPRGRKPRGGTGLIAWSSREATKRPAHRPRTFDPEDEQTWLHMLQGVALDLWWSEEGVGPHPPLNNAVASFIRQPDWERVLRRLIRKAVTHPSMRDHNPPTRSDNPAKRDKALKERARLAASTYTPAPAFRLTKKVGG